MKKVNGTVKYQNLEGGFWSIIDQSGGKWRPLVLQGNLQKEGLFGEFTLNVMEDVVDHIIWGTPVMVEGFKQK